MDRERLKQLAGLVDDEPGQIDTLLEDAYTEIEAEGVLAFWNLQVQTGPQPREAMVADWLRLVPTRTETDLVRLAQARWGDGYRGGQTARILNHIAE